LAAPPFGGSDGAESGDSPSRAESLDKYGRGQYDPASKLYEWYEVPPDKLAEAEGQGSPVTWEAILERWALIEADLHSEYGIDLDDPVTRGRRWRWLRVRIAGLLSADTRIARALAPKQSVGSGQSVRSRQASPEGAGGSAWGSR
jgi:hypothetical protein